MNKYKYNNWTFGNIPYLPQRKEPYIINAHKLKYTDD